MNVKYDILQRTAKGAVTLTPGWIEKNLGLGEYDGVMQINVAPGIVLLAKFNPISGSGDNLKNALESLQGLMQQNQPQTAITAGPADSANLPEDLG